jgi:Zn-dependent protease/CBS domain-containing protein
MKWSFSLLKVCGIDVRIHLTFFLLLAFVGYASYGSGGLPGAWAGISFILLLFLCVLLHEFGHAFAARAFGIRTPDITLLPIGGVARLERMPRNPWQELVVAVAGPAVNVLIAFVLFFVLGQFVDLREIFTVDRVGAGQVLAKLMVVNVWLVLFNLVPAFPMDGGRILRALLALKLRHDKATKIAALVGQVVAVLFAALGLFGGNFILVLIAVFVFLGARQESMVAQIHAAAEPDSPISGAMITQFASLPAHAPLWQARDLARQTMQSVFPVVGDELQPMGVVEREQLLREDGTARDLLPVQHLTRSILVLDAGEPFSRAIDRMQENATGLALVVNPHRQLVGLVSLSSLLERARWRR